MSLRRSLEIAANDAALLLKEPTWPIILGVMPLLIIAFFRPAWAPVLQSEGYPTANGAEQAVPGAAVMFAFFVTMFASLGFFREYIWKTWDRLRSLPIHPYEIVAGKLMPAIALLVGQQVLLFGVGMLLFGLDVEGSPAALVLVDASFILWVLAFILLAVAFAHTWQQALAAANLGAIGLASLGGALTPLDTLPSWAEAIAPITPTYWAMRGFNDVLLEGEGLGAVALPVALLAGSALIMIVVASRRFRFDDVKGGTL